MVLEWSRRYGSSHSAVTVAVALAAALAAAAAMVDPL